MRRNFLVYGLSVLVFGAGIAFALLRGSRLEPAGIGEVRAADGSTAARPASAGARERLREPLPLLLLQLIVIVCAARLCGTAIQRLGQPAVIGEIVAGIALGPSLPGAHGALHDAGDGTAPRPGRPLAASRRAGAPGALALDGAYS